MIDAAVQALASFSNPQMIMYLVMGVVFGTIIGIIPGLGGTASIALLLPVVFKMDDPAMAMTLLIGSLAVVHTSDTISAVLLGAPGSAAASVTMIDGHALAKDGQAARALSVSFLSSMAGGLLGAVGLTLSIPIVRPLILSFASPELFMLCVMGISFAATLSEGKMLKGLIAACIGIFLGMVGVAPGAPVYRYTFGDLHLMDGLPLVAVALGIFGIAEIAGLLGKGGAIANRISVGSGWSQGLKDFVEHRWHVVRGSLVGIWAGVLPGVGATAGTFMAYGQAVATAKDRSKFGKGDVRGIIAPEAANNSCEAGDLIPTLLFSIPGGTPMAILMAVLIFFGIEPGPRIITDHLDMVYTIVWSFALASVLGAALCFAISPALAKLTHLPFPLLVPSLVVLMLAGVYQESGQIGELWIMLILGLGGWILKQSDFPRAPLLIGFVLALPVERYYWLTANLYEGGSWMTRPLVIGMFVITFGSIGWSLYRSHKDQKVAAAALPAADTEAAEAVIEEVADDETVRDTRWSFYTSLVLFLLFAAALYTAFGYSPLARLAPMMAGILAVILTGIQLYTDARIHFGNPVREQLREAQKNGLWAFTGIGIFILLSYLFGMTIAILVLAPLFLIFVASMRWWTAGIYTFIVLAALTFLNWSAGAVWPEGIYPII
jgi:putative tricarboxylic transport membrane protein